MGSELLQKIFRTLGDPTRIRILHLLEREELAVQDLMDVLAMAQIARLAAPRRSCARPGSAARPPRRHVRVLPPGLAAADETAWREAWALARSRRSGTTPRHRARRSGAHARRWRRAATREPRRSSIPSVGEWDTLRKVFNDEHPARPRGRAGSCPSGLRVVDVGTGTGDPRGSSSPQQGLRRRSRWIHSTAHARGRAPQGNADAGDLRDRAAPGRRRHALPLDDAGEVDAAFAHMVLHYLPTAAPTRWPRWLARVDARPAAAS